MVQGYYTLEEAARILGVPADDLNQMAQRREVRAFADRGTWRFRTQDIEELARRKGLGSNPDLPLGEAPSVKPHDSPAPRVDVSTSDVEYVESPLGTDSDQVEIGQEIVPAGGSSGTLGKPSSKSDVKKVRPKTPPPKPGSDSDVRLVSDGSDFGLQVSSESDVKLSGSGPKSKPKKKPGPKQDSDSRLIMESESDSDVKIVPDSGSDSGSGSDVLGRDGPKSGTDSDVRLEQHQGREKGPEDSFLTEEIDLDAELARAEAARPKKPKSKPRPQPAPSPFELSDSDLVAAKPAEPAAPSKGASTESSSDFDLSLDAKDLSPLEISSGEIDLDKSKDEEVALGEAPRKPASGSGESGINLRDPVDSGISLEQRGESSDEIEFELSLEEGSSPAPSQPAEPAINADSSSEFELTLEDSGRLAPLEEDASSAEGEKDIFETDFDVPALEDESGSQAVALDESDTDLESSDFDLALNEEDMTGEEESGSQVVALEDEEDVDEGAATVARPRKGGAAVADVDELAGEIEVEEEEAAPAAGRVITVPGAPADWGVFTPVVLMLSVLVLFFVGLMSFELLHGMWGYRQPYKVSSGIVRTFAGMFYDQKELPPE